MLISSDTLLNILLPNNNKVLKEVLKEADFKSLEQMVKNSSTSINDVLTELFDDIKNNDYAKSWVSKLTYYGIEAMFSDPLYGGNTNQITWSSTNHSIGYPRPVKTYGQKI